MHGTPDTGSSFGYGVIDNSALEQVTEFYEYIDWGSLNEYGYVLVEKGDKWGFVSIESGEEIVMVDDASDFQNGYAIISDNGMGHVTDRNFDVVSEKFHCDSCHTIGGNQFLVIVDEECSILTISE